MVHAAIAYPTDGGKTLSDILYSFFAGLDSRWVSSPMMRAGSVYVLLAVVQRGLGLILLPFVARSMSVAEYGVLSVVVALGALSLAVIGAPLVPAVVRWASTEESKVPLDLKMQAARCWALFVAPSLVSAVALVIVILNQADTRRSLAEPLAVMLVASALSVHMTFYTLPVLRVRKALRKYALLAGAFILASVVSKVMLVVVLERGALGWAESELIASAVGLAISLFLTPSVRPGWSREGWKALFTASGSLLPQSLATWAVQNLSRPAMALSMPFFQVGLFGAAFNALLAASVLIFEFNKAMAVEYAKPSMLNARVQRLGSLQVFIGLTISVLFLALSPVFSEIVLPASYIGVEQILAVLGVAPLLLAVYDVPMNYVVYGKGRFGLGWIPSLAGASAIAVGIVLMGKDGTALAAALVTVIGYSLMAAVALVVARVVGRTHGGWRFPSFSPTASLLATFAIVMPAISVYVEAEILVHAGLAVFSFFLCWLVWRMSGEQKSEA